LDSKWSNLHKWYCENQETKSISTAGTEH